MTEKRQTSQGYIIRILQHFATKLWNITNFAMLALSSCDEIFVQAYLDQNFT
jgi:valyl-tRNA synthetase